MHSIASTPVAIGRVEEMPLARLYQLNSVGVFQVLRGIEPSDEKRRPDRYRLDALSNLNHEEVPPIFHGHDANDSVV